MVDWSDYGLLFVGLMAGTLIGWLMARQSSSLQLLRADERLRSEVEKSKIHEERVRAEVENIARNIGRENTEQMLAWAQERFSANQNEAEQALEERKLEVENLVKPLREEMTNLLAVSKELEKERVGAYEGIKRQIKELGEKTESLSTRTTALSTALTTSGQTRGNWGEVKLRRLFEMAGLSEHVDYDEQVTLADGRRPDFVVRLPQEGVIPIDSKATGGHYLQAVEIESGEEQQELLVKHARAMRQRIHELSAKGYQESIDGEFDHVVMFIPSEAMAAAAFATDPELMEYAMSKSVLIATPVTMLGLLRTVALYWQQHALAEGAKEIYDVSRELYKRVTTMMDHVGKIGQHLDKAVLTYNAAQQSYASRVLPQGKRLDDLKVSETLPSILPEPKDISSQTKE